MQAGQDTIAAFTRGGDGEGNVHLPGASTSVLFTNLLSKVYSFATDSSSLLFLLLHSLAPTETGHHGNTQSSIVVKAVCPQSFSNSKVGFTRTPSITLGLSYQSGDLIG